MSNKELKEYAKKYRVYQYQIAERLGMAESKFSALYRKPISEEMQLAIVGAMDVLSKGNNKQPQVIQTVQPVQQSSPAQAVADLFSGLALPGPHSTMADSCEEAF